jgi:hypothetical protein
MVKGFPLHSHEKDWHISIAFAVLLTKKPIETQVIDSEQSSSLDNQPYLAQVSSHIIITRSLFFTHHLPSLLLCQLPQLLLQL